MPSTASPPRRRRRRTVFALALALAVGLGQAPVSAVEPGAGPDGPAAAVVSAKVDPSLRSSASGVSSFWAVLDEADLSGAAEKGGKAAKGRYVMDRKKAHADRRQAGLRALLKDRGAAFTPYWLVDAVRVEGDRKLLDEVAALPEVKHVLPVRSYSLVDPAPAAPTRATATAADGTEWGVAAVGAPEVWEKYGTRGEGITVANIDTGVDVRHPALAASYRGNRAGGERDDAYNWFDPTGTCAGAGPCDNNRHGTHTMGTMVGAGGTGVAPGATWIAAKGCGTSSCADYDLVAAGQWILAPTDSAGRNPRPDLAPDIVNNSWGGGQRNFWYRPVVDAWIAAGIFPAFSAGNEGPGCDTATSPGDNDGSYSVAAYDAEGKIAPFSSRAGAGQEGKPDIAAPGVNVRSTLPGGGYGLLSGTSMASPHVAGAVALLWSAAPGLVRDVPRTRALLDGSAADVDDTSCGGTAADNRVWGEGKLDVLAAVDAAPKTAAGTLAGTVTGPDGALAGAEATVTGPVTRVTRAAGDGRYAFGRLPAGQYTLEVRAFGFLLATRTLTVVADEAGSADVVLAASPVRRVTGTVRSGDGAVSVGSEVAVPGAPVDPVRTDAEGRFALALPVGSYTLRVRGDGCWGAVAIPVAVDATDVDVEGVLNPERDAFGNECRTEAGTWLPGTDRIGSDARVELPFPMPFYEDSYFSAYVRPYGLLDFAGGRYSWANTALPDPREPNRSVFAFWDSLGTTGPGPDRYTATYGTAPHRVFVVEWRDAVVGPDSTAKVDAAVQLHENGEILLTYRGIDPDRELERGGSATTGIEDSWGTRAVEYSFEEPVLSDTTAIRFRVPGYATLTGSVTDLGSGTATRAQLTVKDDAGVAVWSGITNGKGQYSLRVPTGRYTVTASAPGWESRTFEADLTEEGRAQLHDVRLPSGKVSLSPSAFTVVVPPGEKRSYRLSVSNTGQASTPVQVTETRSSTPPFTDIPWLSAESVDDVAPGGTSTLSFTVDASELAPGKHYASLYVTTPVSGRITGRAVPVTVAVPAYHAYVNAGGPAVTDGSGDTWAADRPYTAGGSGYVGGQEIATGHPIAGGDQELMRFGREGMSAYRFDALPAGIYEVTVKLAEIRKLEPGERVFDIYAGEKPVASGMDISAAVGKEAATERTVFVKLTAELNSLDLRFLGRDGKRGPLVNAVRVVHRPDRFTV